MKNRISSFLVILSFMFAVAAPASFSKGKTAPKKAAVSIVKTNVVKSDSAKSSIGKKSTMHANGNKSTMHANSNKTWSKTHKKHSTTLKNKSIKTDTSKASSSSKTK